MSDEAYHFSPDLIKLLIDTIPLLCRSKPDILIFFRSCGVPDVVVGDLHRRVTIDREFINKYEIARTALTRINEGGDRHLGERRQVIRRVTEFEDFSICWPTDQLKAKGLVASIRDLVNVKDSFTRMSQERDQERREHMRRQASQAKAKEQRRTERADLRRRLVALRSMNDSRRRGLAFESVLNDIFKLDGLSVRESFTLNTEIGQIGEQIDGLVVLDGHPLLVEAKWRGTPLGVDEVSRHLVRIFNRPTSVNGLIVSASEFTRPAIEECKRALAHFVFMLAEVNELLMLLEEPEASVHRWLGAKYLAASVDREPFFVPVTQSVLST